MSAFELSSINTQGSKVLVVDDEKENIVILRDILKDQGYSFSFATSGEEALRIAQADLPDIILLDINMPGLNGLETCILFKAEPKLKHIPIIFVTIKTDVNNLVRAFDVGACDYIVKPVSREEVCVRVNNHLLTSAYSKALSKANETLNSLVRMDGLTGVPNRRFHEERFEEEWARMKREKRPLAAIYVDIDFFKAYNDNFGHLAGDYCLKNVAHALQAQVKRSGDYVARLGGEEFLLVMPNTHADGARRVAELLRQAVYQLKIEAATDSDFDWVSISGGFASIVPNASTSPDELIRQADKALYQAKTLGRNRMECFAPAQVEGMSA